LQNGAGSAGGDGGGDSAGEPGEGHIENTLFDPTELDSQREATRLRSDPSGEGLTTSEIIAGAASAGFATTAYREVFQDYDEVAEEVIGQDTIPGGYRYYVRRYFDLISPRQ
jgi:hypothetical protein